MHDVQVRARGFQLTKAIGEHCVICFQKPLEWCTGQVRDAAVFLRDINGTHGGIDKSCRAVIRLSHGPAVVVEATSADLYQAISAAANRLRETLHHRIGKARHQRRHRHGQEMNWRSAEF